MSTDSIYAELPKFKEKVMYVSKNNSLTKTQTSYVISSSFKGIVRLSPNNHTTVNERVITQLSLNDEASLGTTYTDAIVFEDEALKSTKTDADITRRMIIGSDSDGYLVNFRIGIDDVEFDNLGVIGMAEAHRMEIFTKKQSNNDEILKLNESLMPALAQSSETSSPLDEDLIDAIHNKLDQHKVVVTGNGDKSYLLYGVNNDGKRVFKYKQTQRFIKDLIMQALLDLQTIPTGSVHFVPVTIQQYKALLADGQTPNRYTYISESKEKVTDPIIRDFLLCDGRSYDTNDYPELAKILWGESVVKWTECNVNRVGYKGFYPVMEQNDYEKQEKDGKRKTFRVPDLRHMFISACQVKGSLSLESNPDTKVGGNEKYNIAGTYSPDNLPTNIKKDKPEDDHVHFIAYGTNGMVNRSHTQNFTLGIDYAYEGDTSNGEEGSTEGTSIRAVASGVQYKKGSEYYKRDQDKPDDVNESHAIKLKMENARIMYLQNHPVYRNASFSNGTTQQNGANGFSYGQFSPQRGGIEWKNLRTNWSQPAIMYLSMPGDETKTNATRQELLSKFNNTEMTGYSSVQIPSICKVQDNSVFGAIIQKNHSKTQKCELSQSLDVQQNEHHVAFKKQIYGHETTPKFYAMLPLIKI